MTRRLLTGYKVLATVVGISIITLICIGVPLKYAHVVQPDLWPGFLEVGSPGQQLGATIDLVLGIAHGFIYMAFLLVAFLLALESRWPIGFTLITLLCGTIPFLSFWAERRAIRRTEARLAEREGDQMARAPESG